MLAGDVLAEPATHGFDYGEIEPLFQDPATETGYIDFGPFDAPIETYFLWKDQINEEFGLYYLFEDRLISQWGEGASLYDNELNAIGRWEFLRSPDLGTSSLNIWGQFAQSLGGTTAGMFQAELGVLSPLNGGNGGPETSNEILQMLAWEHIGPGGNFRWQVGKLATRTLVNLNRYANGDSEMYFSPMLGNNPVVPYTALLGLGAFAQWREELGYVSGLVRAADTEKGLSLDAWKDGDMEYIGEFAVTPTFEGLGFGEYRLTLSYDQKTATRPEVLTVSASFDQDFGDKLGGFARFAYADNTFRTFKSRLAGGLQLKKPFGFAFDRAGIGSWWGSPTDSSLSDEVGFEFFYRAQVKRFIEITPDLQVVGNPALSNRDLVGVVGLRFRLIM